MCYQSALLFTSEHDPAPNIDKLLEYLVQNDNGEYLYRGESRIWPGSLFPSAFRKYHPTGIEYTNSSPEYEYSLRKIGRRFVGMEPINFFHESFNLFFPPDISLFPTEVQLLTRLSNDQYLARILVRGIDSFLDVLSDFELLIFSEHLSYWKQIIDYDHRHQIRDMVFMRPFGYLLGQALAQQYGFSSEMLDVTADPNIAAFFATHDSPHFCTKAEKGLGSLYRFSRPQQTYNKLDLKAFNFYSCPVALNFDELLSPFYLADQPSEGHWSKIEGFLVESFEKGSWRDWEAFRVAKDILATTRVTRQAASLLVPDQIYVEKEAKGARMGKVRTLMAVEDCAKREGTTRFFFCHEEGAFVGKHINREYLWPNEEDALFAMFGKILQMNVHLDTGQILPNRLDLLDTGYKYLT